MLVTFDFDDTLTEPEFDEEDEIWVSGMDPNAEALDRMRELAEAGHEIRIVTTRSEIAGGRFVFEFVEDHDLPVSGIHFTDGDLKADTLEELGSAAHFDDSVSELAEARSRGIQTVLVLHPWDEDHTPETKHFRKLRGSETVFTI